MGGGEFGLGQHAIVVLVDFREGERQQCGRRFCSGQARIMVGVIFLKEPLHRGWRVNFQAARRMRVAREPSLRLGPSHHRQGP